MPRRPLKTCSRPGCPDLTPGWLCSRHEAERKAEVNARNPDRHDTYDAAWERARRRQLKAHPFCQCDDVDCKCGGRCSRPAHDVDHITPRRYFTDPLAAHHPSNLRSLCKRCHSSKTARLDGGFGRPPA